MRQVISKESKMQAKDLGRCFKEEMQTYAAEKLEIKRPGLSRGPKR